jgi:hypothetical protein
MISAKLGGIGKGPEWNYRREQALLEQALQEQTFQGQTWKVAIGGSESSFIFRTPLFGEVIGSHERVVDPA